MTLATSASNRYGSAMRRLWVVVAVLVVAGCGDNVSSGFKNTIDRLEANKACGELQRRFNDTDDTSEMKYIDKALDDAGCYDD